MAVDQTTGRRRLAATARSILSCPAEVHLAVDGVHDVTEGLATTATGEEPALSMHDLDGRPVFSCPSDAALARAAEEERGALLTLASGLGPPGSSERAAVLTLTGRLHGRLEECACCDQVLARVSLVPEAVTLTTDGGRDPHHVPLAAFRAPRHHLNRGHLQRAAEHATRCHQNELRHAVAGSTGVDAGDIAGVGLTDLTPDGVRIHWVDHAGGHHRSLHFARAARTTTELGELLREELHPGLC